MLRSNPLRRHSQRLAVAAGLLAFLLSGADRAHATELCLYQGYTDIELGRYATETSGRFALSFVHSVSLTPVIDQYEIRPTGIHQTAEIFEAHGAGLPSFSGDIGETAWRFDDGKFVLEMDRVFPRIQLRIQPEYRNTLLIADHRITLADLGANSIGLAVCKKRGE